ncbi:hypothetical protein MPSEU_000289300 [Mayamaea pseudoterrestris]|nr:hypothetical protein MPSEU_000289300 [Mayamaea pseudoterrestris]
MTPDYVGAALSMDDENIETAMSFFRDEIDRLTHDDEMTLMEIIEQASLKKKQQQSSREDSSIATKSRYSGSHASTKSTPPLAPRYSSSHKQSLSRTDSSSSMSRSVVESRSTPVQPRHLHKSDSQSVPRVPYSADECSTSAVMGELDVARETYYDYGPNNGSSYIKTKKHSRGSSDKRVEQQSTPPRPSKESTKKHVVKHQSSSSAASLSGEESNSRRKSINSDSRSHTSARQPSVPSIPRHEHQIQQDAITRARTPPMKERIRDSQDESESNSQRQQTSKAKVLPAKGTTRDSHDECDISYQDHRQTVTKMSPTKDSIRSSQDETESNYTSRSDPYGLLAARDSFTLTKERDPESNHQAKPSYQHATPRRHVSEVVVQRQQASSDAQARNEPQGVYAKPYTPTPAKAAAVAAERQQLLSLNEDNRVFRSMPSTSNIAGVGRASSAPAPNVRHAVDPPNSVRTEPTPRMNKPETPRPSTSETEAWKSMVQVLRETLDRQEQQIKKLERENEDLKAENRKLCQESQAKAARPEPKCEPPPLNRHSPAKAMMNQSSDDSIDLYKRAPPPPSRRQPIAAPMIDQSSDESADLYRTSRYESPTRSRRPPAAALINQASEESVNMYRSSRNESPTRSRRPPHRTMVDQSVNASLVGQYHTNMLKRRMDSMAIDDDDLSDRTDEWSMPHQLFIRREAAGMRMKSDQTRGPIRSQPSRQAFSPPAPEMNRNDGPPSPIRGRNLSESGYGYPHYESMRSASTETEQRHFAPIRPIAFSPGTQVVGDLSNMMPVKEDYRVPLSYMLDDYYERRHASERRDARSEMRMPYYRR